MALFGHSWLEDNNDDIGPFSHWKDDFIYPDFVDENTIVKSKNVVLDDIKLNLDRTLKKYKKINK